MIFAVHVISLSPFPNSPPTLVYQSLAAQAVREAQEAMNRLEPKWKGVPHETLIRKGDIWRELSRIIEEKQIDLVVCGTHGRTGAAKVLMGSVSEAIYRHAPCPVLTVGPRVAGAPESLGEIHSILCATDFTAESMKRLEDLKEKTDATTKAEVVRNALRLYEWFVTQIDPNSTIEIKDKEGETLYKIPVSTML